MKMCKGTFVRMPNGNQGTMGGGGGKIRPPFFQNCIKLPRVFSSTQLCASASAEEAGNQRANHHQHNGQHNGDQQRIPPIEPAKIE